MKEKIIVTAALPYANGDIHIGHLLEYIQADIYTRFLKLQGKDVLYICASDMHGTPIEINAHKAGISPEKFVEKYWKEHQQDFTSFSIQFDNFYKTHSPENKERSEWFFKELKKKGFIYHKTIKVIYCLYCKRSLPDRFVKGTCPHCHVPDQYGDVCEKCSSILKGVDLLNPYCTICRKTPIQKDSQHYFFKLSAFTGQLKQWLASSSIQPEVKHWLQDWFAKGLEDWCISRDGPYFGFAIPDSQKETGETKYFYVWMDAPIGYISSTKNYCYKQKKQWKQYWYKGKVHHIIGKDIAYFHFLFWPAMLLGMGIPLPELTVHGFITVNGQKMSKSRGTFFTAKECQALFPAEALRFYYASHLDRKVIDVDFNFKELQAVTNNVLVGNIGNFCYRVTTFAEKNYGSIKTIAKDKEVEQTILALAKEAEKQYAVLDFKSAVKTILKITDIGNAYFQQAEPWKAKDTATAKKIAGLCVNIAKITAILVSPILPELSRKVAASLSLKRIAMKDINFRWKGKIKRIEMLAEKIETIPEQKLPEEKKAERVFPVQMAVGKIIEVKNHPNADSLYLFTVDFGSLGRKQVVAGLKKYFKPEQLLHQQAVFCINLKPAMLRGEKSEAMALVADDGKNVSLLYGGEKGELVHFAGFSSSSKEISFEEFKNAAMTVKNGNVWHEGKKLQSAFWDIIVKNVMDGARIG